MPELYPAVEKLDNNEDNFDNNRINKIQENSNMRSEEVVYEVDLDILKESVETDNADDAEVRLEGMFSDDEDNDLDLSEILAELEALDLVNEDKVEIDLGDVELPDDVQLVARLVSDEEEDEADLDDLEVEDAEEDEEELPVGDLEADEDLEDLDEVLELDTEMLKKEIQNLKDSINEVGDLSRLKVEFRMLKRDPLVEKAPVSPVMISAEERGVVIRSRLK